MRVWSWLRMNAGGVPNTCKSNALYLIEMTSLLWFDFLISKSGERVSNTWVTYLLAGDNIWKQVLIPYNINNRMVVDWKMVLLSLRDGPAVH